MLSKKLSNYDKLRVLTLPGLYGSGPLHWQTRWEKMYGFERVDQKNWDVPHFEQWLYMLIDALKDGFSNNGVVLVAHSLGCHLVIKGWPFIGNFISGVFLVAPPDLQKKGVIKPDVSSFITNLISYTRVPGYLIYSENDPFASSQYSRELGKKLGVESISVGQKGHINSESNLGNWIEGKRILESLIVDIAKAKNESRYKYGEYSLFRTALKIAPQSTLKR